MHNKFIAFSVVSAIILISIIAFFYRADENINSDNIRYINSMGRQVEKKCSDITNFKIPEEFDSVFTAYNEIILQAGYDLTPFKGCRAVRYSYIATDTNDNALINIIRCRDEIISADISSSGANGYLKPLSGQD